MEPNSSEKPKSQKSSVVKSNLKKIDNDTLKTLSSFKEKVNKKPFGRKIRDSEILALAVKLLSSEHIKALQERTYSSKDRLLMSFEDYQKTNGKLSYDEFLGKLLEGKVSGLSG